MSGSPATSSRLHRLVMPLALSGMVLLVFWPVVGFDFLLGDDSFNIYSNWRVTRFSLANLAYFWQTPYENLYIPVTYNFWAILARLSDLVSVAHDGRPDPHIFHAAGLLLHLANTLAVLYLLRSLNISGWAGWGGALIFGIHPLQVEPVAWITGQRGLLSGFFSLLALRQYIRYVQVAGAGSGARWWLYGATALFLTLALLAKPGAVVVPLLLLLIGRLLLGRGWRRLALEILPLAALILPVVVMTKLIQPASHHAWNPELWQRLLLKGNVLAFYLTKLVLPYPLGPDYGLTPEVVLGRGPLVYLIALLPLALLAGSWWAGKKWFVAVLIFYVALLPVSGVIPFDYQNISTVADRYLYLAMLGPALAVAWWLRRYPQRWVWGVFLVLVAILAGRAFDQVGTWRNSRVFNEHAVQVNPRSWVAQNNLGIANADLGLEREAIAAFEASLASKPDYADAHNNLGAYHQKLGHPRRALRHLRLALELDPGSAKSAFHLATIYDDQNTFDQAVAYYKQALAIKPDFSEAYNNLGLVYLAAHYPVEALSLYRRALDACPPHPLLYYNLARSYAEVHMLEEAVAALLQATALDPDFAPAYHQLAVAYQGLGDEKQALMYEAKARELGFTE